MVRSDSAVNDISWMIASMVRRLREMEMAIRRTLARQCLLLNLLSCGMRNIVTEAGP